MIFEIAYASSYVKKHYNEHELTKIKYRLWTLLGVLGGFFGFFTILSLILPNHESTINSTILFFGIGIVILIISAFLVKFLEKAIDNTPFLLYNATCRQQRRCRYGISVASFSYCFSLRASRSALAAGRCISCAAARRGKS